MTLVIEDLLTEWGFQEDIDEFQHFKLDIDTIWYLNDQQLEKIFDGNWSKVIKFKLCVQKHIRENV